MANRWWLYIFRDSKTRELRRFEWTQTPPFSIKGITNCGMAVLICDNNDKLMKKITELNNELTDGLGKADRQD